MSRSSRLVSEASAAGGGEGTVELIVEAEMSSCVQTGGTSFMSALAAEGPKRSLILGSMRFLFHAAAFSGGVTVRVSPASAPRTGPTGMREACGLPLK